MKIKGLGEKDESQIKHEIDNGGKFVVYQYCISIGVMTFKRSSAIYFIRKDESRFTKGLSYSLISLLLGWWGFPWGPIYTIGTIFTNLRGGKDVTTAVVETAKNEKTEQR